MRHGGRRKSQTRETADGGLSIGTLHALDLHGVLEGEVSSEEASRPTKRQMREHPGKVKEGLYGTCQADQFC